MINEQLLNKATLNNLTIKQQGSGKWIIAGNTHYPLWSLEEKEEDKWLIILNQVPQMFINTQIALDMIDILTTESSTFS